MTRRTSRTRNTPRPPIASSTSRNTPAPAESYNQQDRKRGLRPVVSLRLEPKMIEQLEQIRQGQPHWQRRSRSELIVEAIEFWVRANLAKLRGGGR